MSECRVVQGCAVQSEAADLHARVGVTDMVNAAPTTPGDPTLDELRRALDIAAWRLNGFSARAT